MKAELDHLFFSPQALAPEEEGQRRSPTGTLTFNRAKVNPLWTSPTCRRVPVLFDMCCISSDIQANVS
ncbi:hypothetical protein CDAR_620921 [Caerostris darwini]|uniref:Uncharacterized protein n=1 Tax=Caerostris darwini TaxID=1538125 RepID=A0AAV4URS2_9ARAC|nr:hypothetical protein CDAR_620921 [Caerostris darwini]